MAGYDGIDHKIAAEQELHVFSSVVEEHASMLINKLKILDKDNTNEFKTVYNKPLKLEVSPYERLQVLDLQCGVERIGKVVLVLSSLVKEINHITSDLQEEIIYPILLYGEGDDSLSEGSGKMEAMLALILPTLNKVQCFRLRCQQIVHNILQQFNVLYAMPNAEHKPINCKEIHLQIVWSELGKLLGYLVTIEETIAKNKTLHQHWGAYRRLVRNAPTMCHDLTTASVQTFSREILDPLSNMLNDIETNVLNGNLLKSVLDSLSPLTSLCRNTSLKEELQAVLTGYSAQLDSQLSSEQQWGDLQVDVLSLTCLYVLHNTVYDVTNNKIAKAILAVYKKCPCICLHSSVVWRGETLISSTCQSVSSFWDGKTCDSLTALRVQYITNRMNHLSKYVQSLSLQVASWTVEMNAAATKPSSQFTRQDLSARTTLVLQGIVLSEAIRSTLTSLLLYCASLHLSLESHNLLNVCHLLHLISTIRQVYLRHSSSLLPHVAPLATQFILAQLLNALKTVAKKFSSDKRHAAKLTDVEACRSIVTNCLGKRPATPNNIATARIALSFANKRDIFKDDELSQIVILFRRLEIMSSLQHHISTATSLGPLLYLYRNVLNAVFTYISGGSIPPHLLPGVLECVNHSRETLKTAKHFEKQNTLLEHFQNTLCTTLHDKIISNVCNTVETELRLSTHDHLHLHHGNPFVESGNSSHQLPLEHPLPYLALPTLNCYGKLINIKECVEQYLTTTFYAFTVVAPHDCQIYQEMRALAHHKWDLKVHNPRLPGQSTHQGVDVLEIVRNLSAFVRSYHYSLSQQVFVEMDSNRNYLNTLNITDIANSIKTHGAGIINTTVNYTYQFLVGKFKIFSQFLYDEQIKSRLVRDYKHWKEVRNSNEKWFPFERAQKLNLGIRKLGLNSQGLSYLDQFRGLVTQIGNAIGYVRLVRSGGLRCSNNTAKFLPDMTNFTPFQELLQQTSKTEENDVTKKAAANLDSILDNLQQSFESETDYFQIMVEVFSNALTGDSNVHLKNFYLIVPALSINFVHYSLPTKDLLKKSTTEGAAFTMDGFAMGVAYLLSVLDQGSQFDSLHWWSGVRRHFISQTEKAEKQRADCLSSGDSKLSETLALTLARLQQHQKEYELLYLTLDSARGFFRSVGTKSQEDKSKDTESVKSGESSTNQTVSS